MAKYVKSLELINENDIKSKTPAKARVELTAAGLKAFDAKKIFNLREARLKTRERTFVYSMPSYNIDTYTKANLEIIFF